LYLSRNNMTIQLINPLNIPNWDDLIRCHPSATPFHSSGWARVLRDTYAFTPYYACVFKGETLSTCLPLMEVNSFLTGRRGVSLPFTDFCAPLLNGTVSSQELTDFAIALGHDRRWKYLELRGGDFSNIHDNSTNSTTSPQGDALAPNALRFTDKDGRWKMEEGSNCLGSAEGDGSGKKGEERGERTEESNNPTPYTLDPRPSEGEGRWKMEDGRDCPPFPNNTPSLQYSNTPSLHDNSTNSRTSPKLPDSLAPESDLSRSALSAPRSAPCALRSYSHHLLDLTPGPDRLFANLRESTRRNIRKAEKEGVTVRFATDLEAVRTYFRLHCQTRKRHGVPPQPVLFFQNLHKYLIAPGQGFLCLADYQGRTIAGAIYLTLGDQAIFKFGASDCRYHAVRPNNLVMWEAIRRLAEDGFQTLSFGRTEPEHKGLIQFKSGWGGGKDNLDYFRYDFGSRAFISGNGKSPANYEKFFQKLPEPALKLVGKVLYRHFGS
jgi:hypothetical protein